MQSYRLMQILGRIDPHLEAVRHEVGYDVERAGLYWRGEKGRAKFVCRLQVNDMPEHSVTNGHGKILVRGWRDVIWWVQMKLGLSHLHVRRALASEGISWDEGNRQPRMVKESPSRRPKPAGHRVEMEA